MDLNKVRYGLYMSPIALSVKHLQETQHEYPELRLHRPGRTTAPPSGRKAYLYGGRSRSAAGTQPQQRISARGRWSDPNNPHGPTLVSAQGRAGSAPRSRRPAHHREHWRPKMIPLGEAALALKS